MDRIHIYTYEPCLGRNDEWLYCRSPKMSSGSIIIDRNGKTYLVYISQNGYNANSNDVMTERVKTKFMWNDMIILDK